MHPGEYVILVLSHARTGLEAVIGGNRLPTGHKGLFLAHPTKAPTLLKTPMTITAGAAVFTTSVTLPDSFKGGRVAY